MKSRLDEGGGWSRIWQGLSSLDGKEWGVEIGWVRRERFHSPKRKKNPPGLEPMLVADDRISFLQRSLPRLQDFYSISLIIDSNLKLILYSNGLLNGRIYHIAHSEPVCSSHPHGIECASESVNQSTKWANHVITIEEHFAHDVCDLISIFACSFCLVSQFSTRTTLAEDDDLGIFVARKSRRTKTLTCDAGDVLDCQHILLRILKQHYSSIVVIINRKRLSKWADHKRAHPSRGHSHDLRSGDFAPIDLPQKHSRISYNLRLQLLLFKPFFHSTH